MCDRRRGRQREKKTHKKYNVSWNFFSDTLHIWQQDRPVPVVLFDQTKPITALISLYEKTKQKKKQFYPLCSVFWLHESFSTGATLWLMCQQRSIVTSHSKMKRSQIPSETKLINSCVTCTCTWCQLTSHNDSITSHRSKCMQFIFLCVPFEMYILWIINWMLWKYIKTQ